MPSKRYIAEQVLFRLKGGYPSVASSVQLDDIYAAINQKINMLFRMQHFTVTLPSGETIPDGLMMATYTVPLTTYFGSRSSATLPVMPVSLTRNMGIYEVDRYEDFRNPFIPLQPGQNALLVGQPLISNLLDQVAYEVYGSDVILNKDLTIDNVSKVYMRLIVNDVSKFDEYTPLPIPSDMEGTVVEEVIKQFAPVQPGEKINDNYSEPKP